MKGRVKYYLSIILALVCAFSLAVGIVPSEEVVAATKKKTYVIVIDPGHDSKHIGAHFKDLNEEEITLKLSKYCKQQLEKDYSNVKVYLTRTDEDCAFGGSSITTATCLHKRALYAKKKKADLFISMHVNSSTGTVANGVEAYSATAYMRETVGKTSHTIASKIVTKLAKLGLANRGTKYANWVVCKDSNEYGIPAVLVEHGFIRNTSDRRWLSSAAKLKKMAQADADGIAEGLGLKKTVSDDDDDEDDEDYDDDYAYDAEDDDDDDDDYYASRITAPVYAAAKATSKATVKLSSIKSSGFAGLEIAWEPFENARGYVVYRRATTGPKKSSVLRKVATVRNATSFLDETCEPATTYQYSVRAFGSGFKTVDQKKLLTKKSNSGGVVGFTVKKGIFNAIDMSWSQKSTATGYEIERATVDAYSGYTEEYGKLATVDNIETTTYTDTTAEAATTYKYRIRAYYVNASGKKQYGTYVARKIKTGNNKVSDLKLTRTSTNSVKISWKAVPKATGYEVSRAKGTGSTDKFTVLGLAENGARTYLDTDVDLTTVYRYRVRAYVVKNSETYWGAYSDIVKLNDSGSTTSSRTPIAGTAKTTVSQMTAFYKASGRTYPEEVYETKGAPTIEAFAKIVYEEATDEDIRPEVVFAQICKETRYLEFGGSVKAKQCNFAGLGATDGSSKGATFSNVRQGVRAQVQHLKAYANKDSLVHSKVDPRFSMVKRGTAPYVEWLGIQENPNGYGWASDKNYGYSLKEDFLDVLLGT